MSKRLQTRWEEVHSKDYESGIVEAAPSASTHFVDDQQRGFFSLCSSYQDILYPARPYPSRYESLCCLV